MLASPIAARTVLLGKVLVSSPGDRVDDRDRGRARRCCSGRAGAIPIAVAALIVATAYPASGIALLVVGFARDEDQAGGAIAIVAMTLAILGGAFFPLRQAPEGLARLSCSPRRPGSSGVSTTSRAGRHRDRALSVLVLLAVGAGDRGGSGWPGRAGW